MLERRGTGWLLWLHASAAMTLGCARTPARDTAPATSAVSVPPATPVATPTPSVAASVTSAPLDAGTAPAKSDPAVLGCGKTTCQSGTETCCLASDDGVCVATEPDGPHGAIGFFKAQWERCDAVKFPRGWSLSGIARCDESVDCKAQEICCEQFLFSGGTVALCEPPVSSGRSPCEFGELCIEGSPCRTPGTTCRRGFCSKIPERLPCGSETCSKGESCCGASPRCKPDAECDAREPRIACARPRDCIAGHVCVMERDSTACTGHIDLTTPGWLEERGLAVVCDRDADCPTPCTGGQRMRCRASQSPGIKACACP